jgi:hypothetical protein
MSELIKPRFLNGLTENSRRSPLAWISAASSSQFSIFLSYSSTN